MSNFSSRFYLTIDTLALQLTVSLADRSWTSHSGCALTGALRASKYKRQPIENRLPFCISHGLFEKH
ncbi:MAG: hypothetical protein D6814_15770 [Calditrichaeota bacterium]|nr:MAG: hypothetical protein D6814_15770 [Calditrichota bacterium]